MEAPTSTTAVVGSTDDDGSVLPERKGADFRRLALLIGTCWFLTNVPLSVMELPISFLLKEELRLDEQGSAFFLFWATFSNYVKPIFGLLTDAVPLFGTRRRGYLLVASLVAGAAYLALPLVPRTFWLMFAAYASLYTSVVIVSTVLGGVMVEIGQRFGATGRLSAQRVGIVRAIPLFAGPLGGQLAKMPLFWATGLSGICHLVLWPVVYFGLRETRAAQIDKRAWHDALEQLRCLFRNRVLWAGVGLIVLVIMAPGFDTPLLYYQTDHLHFSKNYIGTLKMVAGLGAFAGAGLYAYLCPRFRLRTLLCCSIVVHALATLIYLFYHDHNTALWITGLEGMTNILAVLPLYDICIRVTTRGGEGLGYSVMMGFWNLTFAGSNLIGSWLINSLKFHFFDLVWVNAGSTILVLAIVPFLPRVLLDSREGGRS